MGFFKNLFSKNDSDDESVEDEAQETDEGQEYDPDNAFGDQEEGEEDPEDEFYDNQRSPSTIIGQPSLINIIANSYWSTDDVMQEYFIMRETMKHRTYGIPAYVPPSGYPRMVDTGVFQELLAQGNIDLTMDVVPRERRNIMKELSKDLNVIRSNAEYQQDKGQT